ncbi:MAG: phenylalanine--tRNA ligase subunit beta [Methylothermaceae bacteria B42]|nr:MAG: phenylalanine--tRNA ligase subunit beta [Methylothermaceae bacteria B42]HHJ38311.1 phenylalanine--tRNA ligase subunit beta [Methylothermaceae bacterium]
MRFSEAWLREHVNPPVDTQTLVEQLTMAGLEVDSVEPAAPDFSGVVIAQVVSVQPHPNADKLRVCQVSIAAETLLPIVCGAPNVREGMKAPLATVGATLPGGMKIKKAKLRGVESLGMLCSARELGLAEAASGLWELPDDAPVGEDLRQYLQLEDTIIDVDLTPNRADCLSIEGIAREAALLNKVDWRPLSVSPVPASGSTVLPITIATEAENACPRYLGRLITNIDPLAPTPIWMQERLRRSGIRSISAIVDITNYVMLELGQPLHAFDADKLQGGIQVRMGRQGEKLVLLDEQEVELSEDVLVIADEVNPLALAGIMGGKGSAVTDTTQTIFLECAFFSPEAIMGKARRFGLHTDSSHRFERGVDPGLQSRAIERASELILQIAGGSAGPINEKVVEQYLPRRPLIELRSQRVDDLLGLHINDTEIEDILRRLGMQLEGEGGVWSVRPPSFRFDIAIEADLIEEVARVYGYNNLPVRTLAFPTPLQPVPENQLPLDRVKDALVDRGFQEVVTYSFVDASLQEKLTPDLEAVPLLNPLSSEIGVMRTTLWTGLLTTAQYNINRQQRRIRLFETGMRFYRQNGKIEQEKYLAGLATGTVFPEQWGEMPRDVDFFDLKADVEAVLSLTRVGRDFVFQADSHSALHPGQSARIIHRKNGQACGWIGMLHPEIARDLDFDQNIFLFEIRQSALTHQAIPVFRPLSKYPYVRRDIALVIPQQVNTQSLIDAIFDCQVDVLQDVILFDVYQGKGLEAGQKSIALGLILQHPEKTLTDSDIDVIVNKILQKLADQFGAKLRG